MRKASSLARTSRLRAVNSLMGPPDPQTYDTGPGWAWGSLLLPYMEQAPLAASLNFNLPCWFPDNTTGARTTIAVYLCPSVSVDESPYNVLDGPPGTGKTLATFARSNYVANAGGPEPWAAYPPVCDYDGVRRRPVLPQFEDQDQLDHRRALEHRVPGRAQPGAQRQDVGGRGPHRLVCPSPRFAFSYCDVPATMVQTHSGPNPLAMENPPMIHQPNSRYCKVCQMYSDHPNGCNVLMGDGSVRFATMYINTYTWHALATRAGGEIISADQY